MTPQSLSLVTLWAATSLYAIAMVAWAIRLSRIADERVQARDAVVAEPATVAAGTTRQLFGKPVWALVKPATRE